MTSLANIPVEDLEKEARVASGILEQRAKDVRSNEVNWQSYLQGQMIGHDVYNFMVKFDRATPETRAELINHDPIQFAAIFRNLIEKIAKDQTLQYILTLLDDALQEDKSRVEIFREFARKRKESVWQPFFQLLDRSDPFIVHQASRIVAKIACYGKERMEMRSLQSYLSWLRDQLRRKDSEYRISVVRCLQMLLRKDEYRHVFVDIDGMSVIVGELSSFDKIGFQLTYQLVFCLWCLSFNPALAERLNSLNMVPLLIDVFTSMDREKVKRIIVALCRNLLEKPEEMSIVQDNALAMIRCKLVRHMEHWDSKRPPDVDCNDDIAWLNDKLETCVQDLSSFDEYVSEVRSGALEWSPVHQSDRFWGENAIHLNDNNYELLKILVQLLESSRDPLVLSVAAHDIGEYVRHYPRGKNVLDKLGAKQRIMTYLAHEDPNVRYQCLLALQKLMVHNWEYLGKKMNEDEPKAPKLMDVRS